MGTGDVEILETLLACDGEPCFVPGACGLPLLREYLLEGFAVVLEVIVCDGTDWVLIATIMFGGRGTGDCLDGTGAATLAALGVAFANPRTACFNGGGGFDAFVVPERPSLDVCHVARGGDTEWLCCAELRFDTKPCG